MNVLILAPHTDDIEFGCGGTVAKLLEEGAEVFGAIFSRCQASVPEGFPEDALYQEAKKAAKVLGLKAENLTIKDYPVRDFPSYRQDILEFLITLKEKVQPSIILCPSSKDVHQDHKVIFEEAQRAFKDKSIIGYEFPWNYFEAPTMNYFVKLEERHVNRKVEAIQEYETQKHLDRSYTEKAFIEGHARYRGMQVKASYAEAFEMIRWIRE
ncbi:MAG: PIG-L deacetylase family protein [Candidatus Woesearchaeota archaeon]